MNMLSKTLLTLGILFAAAVIYTNAFASPLQDQVFEPSIQLADGGKAFCSGTIISSEREPISGKVSTIVLTAKHCIENADQIIDIVKTEYDKKNRETKAVVYPADVLGTSYKSDLALLRLHDKETLFIKTATVAPKDVELSFGQEVYLAGYPRGLSQTFTKGNLGYVEDKYKDMSTSGEFYRATPDLAPGSSGGAMFTQNATGAYEIIGVTTAQYVGFTFMNLFTPPEEIDAYLEVAKTTYAWPLTKEQQAEKDAKKDKTDKPGKTAQ